MPRGMVWTDLMAYVSLYRKYRSQTFEEVMGQDHVTRTLQNAIRMSKVAHAYLFCGTRGTGKTTTARLLAKALNCVNGPTPQPCNQCPACISITEGSAMDVLEMDAASHTGVDDIEDIRENVKFPPMDLRYKVFIIDEVHQLSKSAKDAFLKTLEEPPSHTVFILATTEPQSIPVTIRSRCQQFDFRRGSLRDIRDRLKFVADSEGVKVDDAALDLMSVNADGSYRDSLSLMEQIFAYTDGSVSVDDVNTVLGTVTQEFIIRLADTIAAGDEPAAFDAAAEVVESGRDIQQILRSIAQHFRNLLFASVTKNLSQIATSEQMAERFVEQASKFSKAALLKAVEIFTEAEKDSRFSEQHRLLLELALLRVIGLVRQPEAVAQSAQSVAQNTVPSAPSPAPASNTIQASAEPPRQNRAASKPAGPSPDKSAPPKPESTAQEQQDLPEFARIEAKWNQVMQHLRTISNPAQALLVNAKPVAVQDGALVLVFETEGLRNIFVGEIQKGKSVTKKQALLMAIHKVFGVANANIICRSGELPKSTKAAPREKPAEEDDVPPPDLFHDEAGDTLSDVLDIFNGEIVD